MQPITSSIRAHELLPASLPGGRMAVQGHREQSRIEQALEAREAFSQFVGQTFFGQLIRAMRTTLGKPAYFHGGQAEEIFRGQLDQQLAKEMTEKSAGQFVGPLFRHQFLRLAELLSDAEGQRTEDTDQRTEIRGQKNDKTMGMVLAELSQLGRP